VAGGGAGKRAAPPAADARGDELAALLARFAKAPGIYARFREEKHLAMLQVPLVNEGTIHFTPPGRLAPAAGPARRRRPAHARPAARRRGRR